MAAFVRSIELGGFSAAAREFGLTPSALSKLVARLEDRLGVRLVHRTTRKLSLTPEGETYFARCQRILADIAEAEGLYRAQADDMAHKGRWLALIAQGLPADQKVSAVYDDARLRDLQKEAANG